MVPTTTGVGVMASETVGELVMAALACENEDVTRNIASTIADTSTGFIVSYCTT